MQAEERTRVVVHHEWTLPVPAHYTEVAKALTVASQKRDAETGYPSDIVFTHGDDCLIIGYEVEPRPQPAAHGANELLRAERDEAQRRAETMSATLKRIRSLAAEWSGTTGVEAAAWRNASMILHETLDGPGDEAEEPDHA